MTGQHDITLYAKRNNKYVKTHIYGVQLFGRTLTNIKDNALNYANEYVIRIPITADCSKEYNTDTDSDTLYTIKSGDKIVLGLIDDKIKSSADLVKKYRCITVLGVTDNRRGTTFMQHIKVVGT